MAAALTFASVPADVMAANTQKIMVGNVQDIQKYLSEWNISMEDIEKNMIWNGNVGISIIGACEEFTGPLLPPQGGEDNENQKPGTDQDGANGDIENNNGGSNNENDNGNNNGGNNNENNNGSSNGNENNGNDSEQPDKDDAAFNYAEQIVELVNKERAANGLGMLEMDNKVQECANVRAKEIVSNFSHTRPNGSSCFTALTEGGVSYRYAGENIAYGYDSAESVMNGWMNSPSHRANILSADFTKIGVGYHEENGIKYWTQFFIS